MPSMVFEFDALKSKRNMEKHGIDFIEAQQIWEDSDLIEIPARAEDEPRFLVIGKYRGIYWSGIVTYRAEKTRIISVRHSRKEEIEIYESEGT